MSTEDGDQDAVDGFVEPPVSADEADQFTRQDELRDIFGNPQVRRTGGHWTANENELPSPILDNPLEDALAPPFTVENQVCIADLSAFVLRDRWGNELARFDAAEVERTPSGRYRVGREQVAAKLLADGVRRLFQHLQLCVPASAHVEVEPRRPQCRHLVLQLFPPAPSQQHVVKQGWMHRYCAARRSVAGAFMGLGDDAMRACSLREPYDVESGRLLQKFDRDLLEKSRDRELHPMFQTGQSSSGDGQT